MYHTDVCTHKQCFTKSFTCTHSPYSVCTYLTWWSNFKRINNSEENQKIVMSQIKKYKAINCRRFSKQSTRNICWLRAHTHTKYVQKLIQKQKNRRRTTFTTTNNIYLQAKITLTKPKFTSWLFVRVRAFSMSFRMLQIKVIRLITFSFQI